MRQAGEGPTVVLLHAAWRQGIERPRERSQALTLRHRRQTFTLPGQLKRGSINKTASQRSSLRDRKNWTCRACTSTWLPASTALGLQDGRNTLQQRREAALYAQRSSKLHLEITRLSAR